MAIPTTDESRGSAESDASGAEGLPGASWWSRTHRRLTSPLRPVTSNEDHLRIQFLSGLLAVLVVLGSITTTGSLLLKLDNPAAHLAWGVEMLCVLAAMVAFTIELIGVAPGTAGVCVS